MKKLLFLLTLLVVGATTAMAQSASANVTVTITNSLAISESGTMDFGTVATTDGAQSINSTDSGAPEFTITGTPSASVTVTPTAPSHLTNGSSQITFTDKPLSYGTTNSQGSATTASSTGAVSTSLSTGGDLYVWIGGTIDPSGATTGGAHTGTYTVAVAYN